MTETVGRTRSEFGKCLVELMQSRDIFDASDLSKLMASDGKHHTDRLIRQYWTGASKRPGIEFMRDVESILKLTPEEMARLCMSVYSKRWREV